MLPSGVTKIVGENPGKKIAIFAGVHGNEKAGVYALNDLRRSLRVTSGTVYLVLANPPAIKADVRMLQKNLNRCFTRSNAGTSYEDARAHELMNLLDECDALLDLHMFYDKDNVPFVICEKPSVSIAQIFDVDIISTGWNAVEPGGSDGYMFENGKIGICVECGPIPLSHDYTGFAKNTVLQFLSYFGMLSSPVAYSKKPKRYVEASHAVLKTSSDFTLVSGLKDFMKLEGGQILASDSKKYYRAGANQCIIFPHYSARIGEEAYIIGHEQRSTS